MTFSATYANVKYSFIKRKKMQMLRYWECGTIYGLLSTCYSFVWVNWKLLFLGAFSSL